MKRRRVICIDRYAFSCINRERAFGFDVAFYMVLVKACVRGIVKPLRYNGYDFSVLLRKPALRLVCA